MRERLVTSTPAVNNAFYVDGPLTPELPTYPNQTRDLPLFAGVLLSLLAPLPRAKPVATAIETNPHCYERAAALEPPVQL